MLTGTAKKRLIQIAEYLEGKKDSLIIDGDTHPTNLNRLEGNALVKYNASLDYYHGRPISHEELLLEMDASAVDMALTWQNPATLVYTENRQQNFEKLLQANRDICASAELFRSRFIPAGWTDPKALGLSKALELVDICVHELGFPIVKMNPAQNGYSIDSDDVVAIVKRIVELGATPAVHYGGDTIHTPADGLKRLAALHPDHPIIAVHMGGGGSHYVEGEQLYLESRELGIQMPNIFFILSAKRDCHIESDLIHYTLAGAPFNANLACGSDAPYGKVAWNYGGYERMFKGLANGRTHPDPRVQSNPDLFSPRIIQGYLGRNLAELVIASCGRVLSKIPKTTRSRTVV